MKGNKKVVVELSIGETETLLGAQRIWQRISYIFDDMGCDVDYIVDVLDDGLERLLNICEEGVLEENVVND